MQIWCTEFLKLQCVRILNSHVLGILKPLHIALANHQNTLKRLILYSHLSEVFNMLALVMLVLLDAILNSSLGWQHGI